MSLGRAGWTGWDVRRFRAAMVQTLPDLPLALCKGDRSNKHFPARSSESRIRAAKLICGQCPELVECRNYALRSHPQAGIWGATTEEEREAIVANTDLKALSRTA